MLPFLSLMVGSYIITKMIIYLLDSDPNQPSRFGLVLNKLFAAGTIIVTIVCLVLIWVSSVGLDINELIK